MRHAVRIGHGHIHVRQAGFARVLSAVAIGVHIEVSGDGGRIEVAVIACRGGEAGHGKHDRGIRAFRLHIAGRHRADEIGVGGADLGAGGTRRHRSGPVAIGVGGNGVHDAVGIRYQHIHVGEAGFGAVLHAIAVGIDIQVAGDQGGQEVAVVVREGERVGYGSDGRGIGALGLHIAGGHVEREVRVVGIDLRRGDARGDRCDPIAVEIRAHGLRHSIHIGDHHRHAGQVGFARVLSPVAIGIDIQVAADGAGDEVAVVARVGGCAGHCDEDG